MSEPIRLTTPLTQDKVRSLHIGDRVLISGTIYAARDAAHKRMVETLDRGEPLPVDLRDQIVYYVGPSPAKPGQAIGSAGPTTSGRMDAYAPRLMEKGLSGMIGKGNRSQAVKDAMQRYGTVYFAATGGAGALLSRCKVFVLKALQKEEVVDLLKRAIRDPRGYGDKDIVITDEMLGAVAVFSGGDARSALSTLEMLILNGDYYTEADGRQRITVTQDTFEQCTSKKMLLYDKDGEEHYNLISALHKSMRNSDADAAVYWLARMLEAGEDPLYVARRVTRFAAEDVGLADPRAMEIAIAAYQACHFIGMPECSVHLTEAVIYLSLAPKSNAMETAYFAARDDARQHLQEPVPLHIRNAPTKLMKELDYGKGYKYAHDFEEKVTAMQCLPDSLVGREYYHPTEEGLEGRFKTRLETIKAWKKEHGGR